MQQHCRKDGKGRPAAATRQSAHNADPAVPTNSTNKSNYIICIGHVAHELDALLEEIADDAARTDSGALAHAAIDLARAWLYVSGALDALAAARSPKEGV
ncbi:MAG TPA: hypothetical protein VF916_12200 [Ktedonobacterales bacterium]